MATDTGVTQFGTYHLSSDPELYSPQYDNNFEFLVTDIDGIMRADADENDDDAYIVNAQQVLRFSVNKASVPTFSQNVIEVKHGNSTMKFAGVPTFTQGSLELVDYIGADPKSILVAWQNLSYNVREEKVGNAADYKRTCYLMEYTSSYELVRTWKLIGCWISNLSMGEFSAESNSKRSISCTIEYDRAIMELPD